jgi:hypothetical protein
MAKVIKTAALVVGAVALVATGVGAIGLAGLAGSLTVAGVSASTLFLVAGGLSVAASLLAKQPSIPSSMSDRLNATIDPKAFRKTWLGSTAGPVDIRYLEWFGPDQERCGWIVCHASHAIEGVDEIWFDDELAWTAAGGTQGRYAGYFWVRYTTLEGSAANVVSFGSGKWNGAHRLTGCAWSLFEFKVTGNSKKAESPFSGGLPSRVTIIGKGGKLYDPRRDSTVPGGSGPMRADDQSTWRYVADDGATIGQNLPLHVLRVVLGWRINGILATGSGVPGRKLNLASWITAANLADELANRSAGGTEPRYEGAGVISEGDDTSSVLDMLCAACCGRFTDTNGRLGFAIAHNDLAAIATDDGLNDDDVIGQFSWDPDPGVEVPNVVTGKYTDPSTASLYQLIPYPDVRIDAADGIDRPLPMDLGWIESPSQAQRVAKQVLQRRQYERMFRAPFDIRAWKYNVGDPLPFTFAPLGFDRVPFRVVDQDLGADGRCVMTLRFETPVIYAWDADDAASVQSAAPIIYDRRNNPLILGINEAATTALWSGVSGEGKPEDGATVGMTPGEASGIADQFEALGQSILGETILAGNWRAETDSAIHDGAGAPLREVVEEIGAKSLEHEAFIKFIRSVDATNGNATFGIISVVDGRLSGILGLNDGEISDISVLTDIFRLITRVNGVEYEVIQVEGDQIYLNGAVHAKTLMIGAMDPEFTLNQDITADQGSQILPGGVVMKWGRYRAAINDEVQLSIVFDEPFPTECQSFVPVPYISTFSAFRDLWLQNVGSPTRFGVTVGTQSSTSNDQHLDGFDWIAFGK